jgi:hypothetical protein
MKKTMYELEVLAEKGEIFIRQGVQEEQVIVLSPDQVPVLAKWLEEAVNELQLQAKKK